MSNKLYINCNGKGAIWARLVAGLLSAGPVDRGIVVGQYSSSHHTGSSWPACWTLARTVYHGEVFVLVTSTVLSTIIILVFCESCPRHCSVWTNGILAVALPLRILTPAGCR